MPGSLAHKLIVALPMAPKSGSTWFQCSLWVWGGGAPCCCQDVTMCVRRSSSGAELLRVSVRLLIQTNMLALDSYPTAISN